MEKAPDVFLESDLCLRYNDAVRRNNLKDLYAAGNTDGRKCFMDEELDLVTLEQEDGTQLTLRVERYFYYNGEEYVILSSDLQGDQADPERYVMRVDPVEGEEDMEEFTPIEDEELEERLIRTAETVLNGEDGADDGEE